MQIQNFRAKERHLVYNERCRGNNRSNMTGSSRIQTIFFLRSSPGGTTSHIAINLPTFSRTV